MLTLKSGLDLKAPDLCHGMVIYGGADLDVLCEGDRTEVRVVEVGLQPGGQKVKVGQRGTHPYHLYWLLAALP